MDSEGRKIIFHIGIHKTGSTFLQEEVFPYVESTDFIHNPRLGILKHKYDITTISKFFDSSTEIWSDIGKKLFKKINSSLKRNKTSTENLILSDEQIFPRHQNDPVLISEHIGKMEKVLASLGYEKMKLICVVRRQDEWMASAYSEASRFWEHASQSHFEEWVAETIDEQKYFSDVGIGLDYSLIEESLRANTGIFDSMILPYEILKKEPKKFIKEISNFCNIKVEKSGSNKVNQKKTSKNKWIIQHPEQAYVEMRPSRIFRGSNIERIKVPRPFRDERIRLTKELSKKILKRYKKSNKKLDKKIHYEMKKYGYF